MNAVNAAINFIIPTPITDVGRGIYHIFKKDVTQEQCKKLVSGVVRIIAVAAVILAGVPLGIFYPNALNLALSATLLGSLILDQQTCILLFTSLTTTSGILALGLIISNIAKGIFTHLGTLIVAEGLLFSVGRFMDRALYEEGGLFGEAINEKCRIWAEGLLLSNPSN